jgi:hypothetical protein
VQQVIRGHKQQKCRNKRGKAVGLEQSLLGSRLGRTSQINGSSNPVRLSRVWVKSHGFGYGLRLDRSRPSDESEGPDLITGSFITVAGNNQRV